jgi:RNA polymerase sigma-70 factor (ECF subfamily)
VDKVARFEESILPHLDAAYNLARWLMRGDADARDVVEHACVGALRSAGAFRHGDGRVSLLRSVRDICHSHFQREQPRARESEFDEEGSGSGDDADNRTALRRGLDSAAVNRAIDELPEDLRETIVLRELEGLSYREIADIAEIPLGVAMERLTRARKRLRKTLGAPANGKS